MNKTKKVALISAIIFVLATFATIIAAPFAVKSCINTYNQLVDEAAENKSLCLTTTTLPSNVKSLTISFETCVGVTVHPSTDGNIRLEAYDNGFCFASASTPVISQDGTSASFILSYGENLKLTEENVRKAIACEINNIFPNNIDLYIPQDVSLQVEDSSYLHYFSFGATKFANREELLASIRDFDVAENDLSNYTNHIAELKGTINSRKASLYLDEYFDMSSYTEEVEIIYNQIGDLRRNMLQQVYQTYYRQAVPSDDYLLVEELCQAEWEQDRWEVELKLIYNDYKNGRITQEIYTSLKEDAEAEMEKAKTTVSQLEEAFKAVCYPSQETEAEQVQEAVDPAVIPPEPVVPAAETTTVTPKP